MCLTDLAADVTYNNSWAKQMSEAAEMLRLRACRENGCDGYEPFAEDPERLPYTCNTCLRGNAELHKQHTDLKDRESVFRERAWMAGHKLQRLSKLTRVAAA